MRLPILAMWVTSTLALIGAERKIRWLEFVFKPITTLLLLAVVGVPHTTFARLVWAGILLSAIGDVALLWNTKGAFLAGLTAFLLAHVAYVIAFVGVAVWSPHVAIVAAVMTVSSTILLRATWKGSAGIHPATIAYGVVISAMVVAAWAMVGGPHPLALFAAIGSLLFYVSDSSLALNLFRKPIPHVAFLAIGVYWIGQLGIAIAASGSL
jgi:alkenylglycerophosphocholine hydrolase